jgi:hypothetical protein
MQKLKLPIIISISRSRFPKIGTRVGGCGRKSTEPKSRRIHELNAQGLHRRHQLTRVNSANVLDEGLMIGGRGHQMNSKVKDQTNRAKLVILLRQI